MKKYLHCLLALFCTAIFLTACEENLEEETEFYNWKARNEAAFLDISRQARNEISQARAQYGDNWEEHCKWRIFRTYAQSPESAGTATDSICVEIIETGNGSGCPLYTDSVKVNYVGRLIPSDSYPDGYVFDHSSPGSPVEDVFNPNFATPTMLLCSNTVEGFTTALQKMHIGDRWKVYMPQQLGYGSAGTKALPSYSALIFEIQLLAYYRVGFGPNTSH